MQVLPLEELLTGFAIRVALGTEFVTRDLEQFGGPGPSSA